MDKEEWDRQVEFILNQQAQFSADIGRLKEAMDRLENIVASLGAFTFSKFEELEAKTAEKFGDVDAKIAALVDSQIKTEEIARQNTESIRNLTAVVNRYFAERNGEAKADD